MKRFFPAIDRPLFVGQVEKGYLRRIENLETNGAVFTQGNRIKGKSDRKLLL
jgi:hypothetical protein